MSKARKFVEICAPDRLRTERFTSRGHKCPYCGGRGYFIADLLMPGVGTIKECPDCDGTGLLTAAVTVEWKPAKKTRP